MAVLTANAGVPFNGVFASGWQTPVDQTATSFRIPVAHLDSPFDNIFVNGTGFTYVLGLPQTGTITDMFFSPPGGGNIYSLTGLSHDAATAASLIGDEAALVAFILNGSDTFLGSSGNDSVTGMDSDDTLYGAGGIDTLGGEDNNDFLFGGNGNDILDGGFGLDTAGFVNTSGITIDLLNGTAVDAGGTDSLISIEIADGSANNDLVTLSNSNGGGVSAYGGNDSIFGGTGGDLINVGSGNDSVSAGDGLDLVSYAENGNDIAATQGIHGNLATGTVVDGWNNLDSLGGVEFLEGNGFGDTLIGSIGNNQLFGLLGNDSLFGGDGGDVFHGGGGNDSMFGGAGNDTFFDLSGNDLFDGGADIHDRADFTNSNNSIAVDLQIGTLNEGGGTDTLLGIEWFFSGSASDTVTGNGVFNFLTGNAGHDSLFGVGGDDQLQGGIGNDTINGGAGGNDIADFFTGFTALGGITATVGDLTVADGAGGFDSLIDVEGFVGGSFSDTLIGDAGRNGLFGGSGNDSLYGGAGNDHLGGFFGADLLFGGNGNDTLDGFSDFDTLYGGDGNDSLDAGSGNDTLFGGAGINSLTGGTGDDTFFLDMKSDVVIEAAAGGTDGVGVGAGASGVMLGANVELGFAFGAGDRTIVGNSIDNTLTGGTGNDRLDGADGLDRLIGGNGNDRLFGGNGADSLLGGDGVDILTGGAGLDRLDGGDGGDAFNVDFSDVVQDTGGTGIDKVVSNGTYVLAAGSGVEQLTTLATVVGGNLVGDEGDNAITGNTGVNTLSGGVGNDVLLGLGGADRLIGGLGRDKLTGGADADTYQFGVNDSPATATGYDTVMDHATGVDRFDLSIFGAPPAASAYAEVALASNNFAAVKAAAEAQLGGTVRAVFVAGSSNGWLFWNTDGNLATAEQAVLVLGRNNLNDFAFGDLT